MDRETADLRLWGTPALEGRALVEPPYLCGGRSALALCERVSSLVTHFTAGNAKGSSASALISCPRSNALYQGTTL